MAMVVTKSIKELSSEFGPIIWAVSQSDNIDGRVGIGIEDQRGTLALVGECKMVGAKSVGAKV